jgi:large repetitive protein
VLSWTQTPTSNYWAIGVPVTFKATVSATSAGSPGLPTGTVTFNVDGVLTVVPLINGVATMPAPTTFGGTPPGNNHTVSVAYDGPTANFAPSAAAPVTQDVHKVTTLTLTSSAAGTVPNTGTAVTFTAVVSTTALGGPPTGTLDFIIDGVHYTGVLFSSTTTSATYKFTTSTLTAGSHTITAHYSGDANFNPADPLAPLTQSLATKVGRST